ncbi:MAG: FISUMP domain-containing protein, partial [Syntrophothermus sp.]
QLVSCLPLYQWDELMQYETASPAHGLCPPGWHIPSESEWTTLFSNWTNEAFAGSALKYSGYSGFLALLNGAGFQNTSWKYDNWATFFWSSTSPSDNKAWAHGLNEINYSVSRYPSTVSNAFSVRCIKN